MQNLPETFQEIDKWKTHRRKFIKAAILAGITTQVPFITACSRITEEGNEILSGKQMSTLKEVLSILWPNDGNGPGIEELNTLNYIIWVLRDDLKFQSSNNKTIEGIDWIDQMGLDKKNASFVDLSQDEKEDLIAEIINDDYGKDWCDILLTLTFESLILDPIYGAQPNEVGWKWLGHTPGQPRPTEENRYEQIVKIKRNEI